MSDSLPFPKPSRRIALYSHDTQGLGHLRRNLLIASALGRSTPRPTLLLISGAREIGAFPIPPFIDCVTLPALGKRSDGTYCSRRLDVSTSRLIGIRSSTIAAALAAFEPDILIADKVPGGAMGELIPALSAMKQRGATRTILGLRDILDERLAARSDWERDQCEEVVARFYDNIWLYGDRAIFDPVVEYGLSPMVAAKIRQVGYLNPLEVPPLPSRRDLLDGLPADARLIVCTVGGGQDGVALARAFLRAKLPDGLFGVVVTGPFMRAASRASLHRLAASNLRSRVLEFVCEPFHLYERAERIIAMGGYNTCCEMLAFRTPALIVPRVAPRTEQLIRAQRFHARGLVDWLHPAELTPERLEAWMVAPAEPPRIDDAIDFGGVARLRQLLVEISATYPKEPTIAAC